jgi:hypothetical protein
MHTYLWTLFGFQVWCKLYYPDRQPILVEVMYIIHVLKVHFYLFLLRLAICKVLVNVLKGKVVRENYFKNREFWLSLQLYTAQPVIRKASVLAPSYCYYLTDLLIQKCNINIILLFLRLLLMPYVKIGT